STRWLSSPQLSAECDHPLNIISHRFGLWFFQENHGASAVGFLHMRALSMPDFGRMSIIQHIVASPVLQGGKKTKYCL
ncbi:MAG: hypothetical protein J6V15_02320, partial [Clostridia bacterium]|nr:hypothetical protein [Clostridia bacterium]